ncbi:MAG: hypothetical protein IKS55_11530 [Oscillospiraceae bacterium]|nr:hypothetical protein [Oscillospiraceae bacterium]
MDIDRFLRHFDNVKECSRNAQGDRQWSARCPAHSDRVNSLHIALSGDGKILCNCKAGCAPEEVVGKVGLRMHDLFPDGKPESGRAVEVDVYEYRDVQHGICLRKHRMRNPDGSKYFWWDHEDDGVWQRGLNGLIPNLYGLNSLGDSQCLFVVEGEKDVNTVVNTLCLPCVTTPDGGGGRKKWQDAWSEVFRDRFVYILPDNDSPGLDYARFVYDHVKELARAVHILNLKAVWPEIPEKGDISDMVEALGAEETIIQLANLTVDADDDIPGSTLPPVAGEDISSPAPSDSSEADWTWKLERYEKPPHYPKPTINNFYTIMQNEPFYNRLRFNLMTLRPEVHEDGCIRIWTDTDDAKSRCMIEQRYHIHSRDKHSDALKLFWREHEYNPLVDLVSSIPWDGNNRIEHFLYRWLKVEDSPYTRQVSLLIFAGGIHRLMNPGCKFDEVPVLVGKQGSGKSTIVRWLALDDTNYTATGDMSGEQKSIEALQGAWIVEIPELAAFSATTVEKLKSFVSACEDKYRLPYDRNVTILPRHCVFIGTTNNAMFLTDKTGNRRFYPSEVHSSAKDLYEHEEECRSYIAQCWAEALVRYYQKTLPSFADPSLTEEYFRAQENAMEDDWREGAVDDYLSKQRLSEFICKRMVIDYLYPNESEQTKQKMSRDIGQILSRSKRLVRTDERRYLPAPYGRQRGWLVVDPDAVERCA